jgi:murein DD-endopeptidase MepM/ murein hydrolase activator NlpD
MKVDKGFRFFLVNDKKNRVSEIFISNRSIALSLFSALGVFVALLVFTTLEFGDIDYSYKLRDMQNKNMQLVSIIDDMRDHLDDAETQLADLTEKNGALRNYANLPQIDDAVKRVGIGGTIFKNRNSYSELFPVEKNDLLSLEFDLDLLSREINLQKNSYEQIFNKVSKDIVRLKHLPSIPPVTSGFFTSSYGTRKDPFTQKAKFHKGQDFAVMSGTPVYATADGKIISVNGKTGYGNIMIIDHGYGYRTLYAHLSRFKVTEGQTVTRGQLIAVSGNTGRSTGPHLHYEIRLNNVPVNPRNYFFTNNLEL